LRADRLEFLNQVGFVWRSARLRNNPDMSSSNCSEPVGKPSSTSSDDYESGWSVVEERDGSGPKHNTKGMVQTTDRTALMVRQKQTWDESYQSLVRFKNEHGHCHLTTSHKESYLTLYRWSNIQRTIQAKGKLPLDRVQKLEELGFKWRGTGNRHLCPAQEATWQEQYQRLLAYKLKHGNFDVSVAEPLLGDWVAAQRRQFDKQELTTDRVDLLNKVGFVWRVGQGQSRNVDGVASSECVEATEARHCPTEKVEKAEKIPALWEETIEIDERGYEVRGCRV
jgi:hypothetical protein